MAERGAARVYVSEPLAQGNRVGLAEGKAHHLRTVLRLGPGAAVAAFNERDGEWLCRLDRAGLAVERQLRPAAPQPDLWLLFAPIKRARLDWVVEKASELGVYAFLPVWTARTQVERVNLERLRAHAVAAAEQCERLSVPQVRAPQALSGVIAQWPQGRRLFACDESGEGVPIAESLRAAPSGPAAVLVGPEGGFAETELDALRKLPFVSLVGLGPRVLRAETAAVAALAVYQAIAGDWRRAGR